MNDNEESMFWILSAASVLILMKKRELEKTKTSIKRKYTKKRYGIHPILKKRQQQGHYNNLLQELRICNDVLFFNYTRMSVTSFDELVNIIRPSLEKYSRREAISPGCRLALTLRYLATGDSYTSIGYAFRVGVPTVCNIVREVCAVLWEKLSPQYLPVLKNGDYRKIALRFATRWGLPNCCGAIDGKHIVIQAPYLSGSTFFNYKKTFSIVLLAMCDADYNFTVVDIGAYGSESDGGILSRSAFGKQLYENTIDLPPDAPFPKTSILKPHYLIGDEAFPLRTNLMRPYSKPRSRPLSEAERIFNYRLSS